MLNALLAGFFGAYGASFLTGFLTVCFEWKKIHATTAQKIWSIFLFPFYIISFLPIMATAIFKKPVWTPIAHTQAITAENAE